MTADDDEEEEKDNDNRLAVHRSSHKTEALKEGKAFVLQKTSNGCRCAGEEDGDWLRLLFV